jgi:hypothetical protein
MRGPYFFDSARTQYILPPFFIVLLWRMAKQQDGDMKFTRQLIKLSTCTRVFIKKERKEVSSDPKTHKYIFACNLILFSDALFHHFHKHP